MRALASRLIRASTYLVLLSMLGNTALAPAAQRVPLAAVASALHVPMLPAPAAAALLAPSTSAPAPQPDVTPASLPAHAQLPTPAQAPALAFIENTGETDAQAKYFVHGLGGTVFFGDNEVTFSLPTGAKDRTKQADDRRERKQHPSSVARLRFQGANPQATIVKGAALTGTASFFFGSDPAAWKRGVTTYASLAYQNLYAGIDLEFAGTDNQLKSTYTVAPGADPSQIRWHYPGAARATIDATGALRLTLPLPQTTITDTVPITGVLAEEHPVAWQNIGGQRHAVDVQYRLQGNDQISFVVGSYDTTQPLIIDPTLGYQTTFTTSTGGGVATFTDTAGTTSVYISGQTSSTTLPGALNANAGSTDAFVSKLDANGTVLYTLYLGGSGDDDGNGIAVDSAGNAYLTGTTAGGLPVQNAYDSTFNGFIDAFVAKISPSGSLVSCTYLGGSGFDGGYSIARAIALELS